MKKTTNRSLVYRLSIIILSSVFFILLIVCSLFYSNSSSIVENEILTLSSKNSPASIGGWDELLHYSVNNIEL